MSNPQHSGQDDSFGEKLRQRARVENEPSDPGTDFVKDILGMAAKEPLSEEYRERTRQYIREFMKRNRMGPKRLARRSSLPVSRIKDALCRVAKFDPDETLKKLLQAINLMPERSRQQGAPHEVADINLLHDIHARVALGINMCKEGDPEMTMIIGPAGCGKSLCLQGIAQYYADAVYLCITEATARTLPFLRELAERLGLAHEAKTVAKTFRALETGLQYTYRLLIFDEMHLADKRLLNVVRELMDTTHCPIVLAGQPDLRTRIFAGRYDRSRGATIYRRVGPALDVLDITATQPSPSPGKSHRTVSGRELIHTREDVCKVIESRRLRIRIDPEAMLVLVWVANYPEGGMLGTMIGLVRHCLLANPGADVLTADLVTEALRARNTVAELGHLQSFMSGDPLATRIHKRYAKSA